MSPADCEGCGAELSPVIRAMDSHLVCMECVRARARAAFGHGCKCGRKRRESGLRSNGMGRSWVSCLRCLGQIRQVS